MRTSLSTLPPVVLSTTVLFVMRSRAWAEKGHIFSSKVTPRFGEARFQDESDTGTTSSGCAAAAT